MSICIEFIYILISQLLSYPSSAELASPTIPAPEVPHFAVVWTRTSTKTQITTCFVLIFEPLLCPSDVSLDSDTSICIKRDHMSRSNAPSQTRSSCGGSLLSCLLSLPSLVPQQFAAPCLVTIYKDGYPQARRHLPPHAGHRGTPPASSFRSQDLYMTCGRVGDP